MQKLYKTDVMQVVSTGKHYSVKLYAYLVVELWLLFSSRLHTISSYFVGFY